MNANPADALLAYVAHEDGALRWEVKGGPRPAGAGIYEFTLTSQIWQGRTWTHRMQLFVPHSNPATDTILLYATAQGGQAETEMGVFLAEATGVACAFLYDIPNQPLCDGLYEDALIAHTLLQYLDTGDASWPLLFPMVKSVTRAMNALQAFSREQSAQAASDTRKIGPFTRFFVTGASKRGWTSWLAAAADPRVQAILPMVYDNLNIPAQMQHQMEVAGGFSESIHDYTELNLQARMQTPEGQFLAQMIDPYTFRDRLTLPKLIINGSNDSYWMTDALNLYWNDLSSPKHVLYVPNAGHSLNDLPRLYGAIVAFVRATAAGDSLPSAALRLVETANGIEVTAEVGAMAARVWLAHSDTRDFRASVWSQQPLTQAGNQFSATIGKPESGYIALFGEFDFSYRDQPYVLSTPMHVCNASLGLGVIE
jgi:PhoPQ-activated pathogenicity-related protein